MSSLTSLWLRGLTLACVTLGLAVSFPLLSQEVDPEEAKEKAIVDRFVTVLEKNPRRGTALDKVYGFRVERGSLDGLIKSYRERAEKAHGTDAATAWMVVGLMESLRGQDAASVKAFEAAEAGAKENYLASYYLGQALVLVGQPDKAAEAFERAIERKPAQADLLDVFQALGRVYQRAQKADKALEVWNRLEKQFPNDARVQEQIATTLLEEGEFAAALPRFENLALAKVTKDKYRQSLFQMEAAEIKVRLGKGDDAIKEFEKLLGQLNPDNWLFREVRRRIEAVYLRTDDQTGLASYYEAWIKKNPEDLEAISRLARLYAGLGRGPEAQQWLEKGLRSAPTKKELRLALINHLNYEQKFAEAIAQYEAMDKHEPNNPDTLRDWGRLILKDTVRDEVTRKKDAAAVWRRLVTAKPRDPLVASQVAELFRQVEMTDEALELYKKSVELAPDQAQYREYLGEYYHSLKRKDEALATWRQIADGKLKTAPNLSRLAEVLSGFGYIAEAVEANADACKLDPKEINLQIKQADLLSQADKHDESLKQLDVVKKLAANDEEREAWLQRDLRELQTLDKLKDRVKEVRAELEGQADKTASLSEKEKQTLAERWFWLARAHEVERQLKEAAQAVTKASELAAQAVPILMASARIHEAQNNLLAAVEINTKLASIDRRYRSEYLKQVATLEQKLGRRDKAMQAGRDLIASAPGNPEVYEFFSQLCFSLGENDEGLGALRRSVRVNPTEPKGLLLLASALGEQFRTGESIELYWRAFDKATNLEDRLGVVPKLTELYLQTNQFDRLLERLERQRREPNQQREMTICLAQAYQSAGDDGNARIELEKLLTDDTRDTQLLQQLTKLCEADGDLDAAIRFQQQMNKVAPGREGTMRLAQLLMKSGESEEASVLMARISAEEKDPEQVFKTIDALFATNQYEQILRITERLTRDQPKNWELLYREGVALAKQKPEEAAKRFETILALNEKDSEQSLAAKSAAKKAAAGAGRSGRAQQMQMQMMGMHAAHVGTLQSRVGNVYQIRQAIGLDQNEHYYGGGYPGQQQQRTWTPNDYGEARLACLGWLMKFAQKGEKPDELYETRKKQAAESDDPRVQTDWYYLISLRHESHEQYNFVKKAVRRPDATTEMKTMYLQLLSSRGGPNQRYEINEETGNNEVKLEPLDNEELELVLTIHRELGESKDANQWGNMTIDMVAAELKRAGREAEAEKMFADRLAAAKEPQQVAMVLPGVIQRGEYETALKLLDRLAELKADNSNANPNNANFNYAQYVTSPQYQAEILGQLMWNRAKKDKLDDVLSLWKRYVAIAAKREKPKQAPGHARSQFNPYGGNTYFNIYYVKQNGQRGEQLDFPSPNDIYDHYSIQSLRQTYALYHEAERQAELIDVFTKTAKDTTLSEAERRLWHFGLGYLHWWSDDKDEALSVLSDAIQPLSENMDLRFELARLHEKRNERDQALAIIDSLTPSDQTQMQQREVMALRLAVNSGNIDRARTAAERLFGLRLDSNLQMALARQMHQLGMHEQAEAVLARAGRQAGNKTDVMTGLMEQYASTGKNDVAVQIAHQLLRRSVSNRGGAAGGMSPRGRGNEDGARQQALSVLNRSGKLPEMIAKVESQLEKSPKSQRLIETLLEYYSAAGNDKKVAELNEKMSQFKLDDPQFRYQLGMKLLQAGKTKEAGEHFKVVIAKDQRTFFNRYWEIQNGYEQHNKLEEYADLLEDVDLKTFRQQPWYITNVISNMAYRDKTKDRSVVLFKKAWEAMPDQRSQLLSSLHHDHFWKLPEIYDYARQGMIPTETSVNANPWAGFGQTISWSGNGKMDTLLGKMLTLAQGTGRLDALATEVEGAIKKLPKWEGGPTFLALINLRRGKIDEAKPELEKTIKLIEDKKSSFNRFNQYYGGWELAQEMWPHEPLIEMAIRLLEAATNNPEVMTNNEFEYTPGKPLVNLYKQRGRKDDARKVMLKAINSKRYENYDRDYQAYQRVRNAISMGKEFREMGFPADAIKIYQQMLSRTEDLTTSQRYGGGNMKQELNKGMQTALADLKPETLPDLLSPTKIEVVSKDEKGKEKKTEIVQGVDLLLVLDSRELDKTKMSSALVNLMASLGSKPELLEKTKVAVLEATSKQPDDFALAILNAEVALSAKDSAASKKAVESLLALVDKTPLESEPAKGGFNVKQREAAMRQVPLWLVARDCLIPIAKPGNPKATTVNPLHATGEKLATRAFEAAKRQSDNAHALAILREWGQLLLNTGDKPAAEAKWAEMLQLVIPPPSDKAKKPVPNGVPTSKRGPLERNGQDYKFASTTRWDQRSAGPPQLASLDGGPVLRWSHPMNVRPLTRWEQMLAPALVGQVLAAPLPIRSVATPATSSRAAGVTFSQFEQAAQIAKLAADHGMTDLSLRAMTQALHGGPPLEAMQEIDQSNPFGQRQQVNENSPAIIKVQQQLAALEQSWRQKGVTDDVIYTLLRGAVLPESRPIEVFLYPQPLASSPGQQPQSVGAMLVKAALKANKTDDLKAGLESRLKQPLGELSARIILAQLALASRDTVAAKEQLTAIGERLKLDSLQHTSELACHVALPAMTLDELPPVAVALVEKAVDHFRKGIQTGQSRGQIEPSKSLTYKLAQYHFQNGNADAGKKLLEGWITLQGQLWSNYSGDYPAYQRKLALLGVAGEYARAGLKAESLDMLGRFADAVTSRDYQVGGPGKEGAAILSSLASLKPTERYDLLKAWSMPTKDRQSVRFVASLVPGDKAPSIFDSARGATPRSVRQTQFLGSADLLVGAAAATGKLNELQRELEPLAEKNVENAKFLLLLTRLAQPDDTKIEADLRADLAAQRKADAEAAKTNTGNSRRQRPDLTNAIMAQAATARAATREAGLELALYQFTRWSQFQDHLNMTAMRHLYNATVVGEDRAAHLDSAPHDVGLAHWTGGAFAPASYVSNGAVPSWWLTHDGMIQHVCGPDQSYLFFNYPLTGTFEFTCDAWLGSWAEGNAGYGGLVFDTLNLGNNVRIYPIGNRGNSLGKPDPMERRDQFNRITIRVQPDKVQHLVNGVMIHEEKTSGASTSPWLLLQCDRVWQSAFRDLRITGTPEIPREVKLTDGSSLLGWSAGFYGENQAPHFKTTNESTGDAFAQPEAAQPAVESDWWAINGEIHGRRIAASSLAKPPVMQSRLHYCRPLRNGDKLRYEFWYEPGAAETHVHPALDRLAMMFHPDGVKLHWMTDSNQIDSLTTGLPNDNQLEDAAGQRSKGPLPLKEGDWNHVELALNGDIVSVSLNETPIYERTLEPDNDRQFGFYHDKHATAVRVRNVVLTGDWPKSFTPEIATNLIAPVRQPTADERRQLSRAFDDKYAAASIDQLLLSTSALPSAERYSELKRWVLPNDDHSTLRLYADFTPADYLSNTDLTMREEDGSPRRQRFGGELMAPVLDLIAVAMELGNLNELEEQTLAIQASSPLIDRNRKAMLGLIALARNDIPGAAAHLKSLTPIKPATLSDDWPLNERWAEFLLVWESIRIPELRSDAKTLVDFMIDSINRKGIGGSWEVKLRGAKHRLAEHLAGAKTLPTGSTTSPKGQWAQVTFATTESRGIGLIPAWRFAPPQASHIGGHGNDLIYFQSPLRGKFAVEAEVSTFGWRELRLMYNTNYAAPNYTHEQIDAGNLLTNWNGGKITPKIEPLGDWYSAKLEIEPGKMSWYANGRKFHEVPLPPAADPWLAVHTWGHYGGAIRSLRITGQPEIPTEINITAQPDLNGWWPGMYADPQTGENPVWKRAGDEIVGRKFDGEQGRFRQSLLQYHRPLLEDGEITYEFFHVPGQTHVHPSLDRVAFLLEPDGVKEHWLTAAQYERTGLAPDNVTIEKECQRGPEKLPLKPNDWNRVKLVIAGDTLTLALNDVAIYERPVEPWNQRQFGLFRYGGDTDVRVKNVIYRGNWPKALPSVKEQELAGNDLELATFHPGDLPATFTWNFQGKRPGHLNESGVVPTTKRTPIDGGLRIVREPNADRVSESAGIQWPQISIGGDFEVTLGYRDFESSTKNEDHQVPRMEIILAIGGGFGSPSHSHTLALTHRRRHDGSMQMTSITGVRRNPPAEDWEASDRPRVASSARIRIVRRNDIAYFLHAQPGSDVWELLDRRQTSTSDVNDLLIGFRTEDLAASASTVLTEFSVRAKRLSYEPHFANGDSSSTITWNFRDAQPPLILTSGVTATSRVEQTERGMKLVRELNTPASTIGYEMRDISIKGDFVATLDYEQFETKNKPTGDGGAVPRVEMMLALGGRQEQPHTHLVSYMHRRERDGRDVSFAFVGTKPKQGDYSWAAGNLQFTGVSGRLRIIRQGSNMTFVRADAGSNDWKQVSRHPVGQADVKQFVFGINAQDPESTASVLFTGFTVEATGIASIGAATFDAKALPEKLEWNFQGERPSFLKQNKTAAPNLIEPTDKGLKLTRAPNAVKGNDQVSLQWNGLIQGDFEITADYRDYKSTSIGTDWKVPRVELSSFLYPIGGKDHSHVFAVYHERKANSEAIQGQVGTRTADNQFTWTSDVFSQERSAGRLRLARKGSRHYYLTAPTDSNDWTLVGFNDLGNEDLRQLLLSVRSDDLTADVTATLTKITIRAAKIEGVK